MQKRRLEDRLKKIAIIDNEGREILNKKIENYQSRIRALQQKNGHDAKQMITYSKDMYKLHLALKLKEKEQIDLQYELFHMQELYGTSIDEDAFYSVAKILFNWVCRKGKGNRQIIKY
jgi:hypothetical protein